MEFWKKRQQQEEANERTDNSHPHKRLDAIDAAIAGVKEAFEALKGGFAGLRERVDTLWNERDKHMVDLTALTAAVTANTTAVTANTAAVSAATTAVANSGNAVDPAALAALTSQLSTNNTTLEANNTALQHAVAAVTPAPATPPAT